MHILSLEKVSPSFVTTTVLNSELHQEVKQQININRAIDIGVNIIKEQLKTHANMQIVWAKKIQKTC